MGCYEFQGTSETNPVIHQPIINETIWAFDNIHNERKESSVVFNKQIKGKLSYSSLTINNQTFIIRMPHNNDSPKIIARIIFQCPNVSHFGFMDITTQIAETENRNIYES